MVEVFKTNCNTSDEAAMLVHQIHLNFTHYKVNFDLDDHDKILRVRSTSGSIQSPTLISFLKELGFYAEVLSDDLPLLEGEFLLKNPI